MSLEHTAPPLAVPDGTIRTDYFLIGVFMTGALFATTYAARLVPSVRDAVMAVSIVTGAMLSVVAISMDASKTRANFFGAPLLLYVYLLLMLTTNIVSGGVSDHFVPFAAQMVATFIFFFLVPNALLRDPERLEFFLNTFIVFSALVAFTAFLPYVGLKSFFFLPLYVKDAYTHYAGFAASGGITEYPLTLGTFMMMAIALSAYRYLQKPSRGRAALIILFVLTLIASQARGGFFALGVAGTVFICPRYFLAKGWRLLTLMPVLLILAILAFVVLSALPGVSGYFRTESGTSDRTMIWAAVLFMVAKNPWTGYGFGSSNDFVTSLGPAMKTLGAAPVSDVHNTFLTSAFEGGVLTALTYAALFLFPIYLIAQSQLPILHKRFYIGIGLGIFVANIWIDNNFGGMRITSVMVTVFIGLAYQLSRMAPDVAVHTLENREGSSPLLEPR